jgi:hypothetical protein
MTSGELDELWLLSEVPKIIEKCDIKNINKKEWYKRGEAAKEQEQHFEKINKIFKEKFEKFIQKDKKVIRKFINDMSFTNHSPLNIGRLLIEEYTIGFHLKITFLEILEWYKTEEGKKIFSTLDTAKQIDKHGVVEVDMKKIVATNKNLNRDIEEIINRMIEMIGVENESAEYIYIVHRNDGMVVVVGKSSFTKNGDKIEKCGDLFSELNTSGLIGTENIILRTLYGNEIDSILANYYKTAWVIPISPELSEGAAYFEKNLGNYLLEKGIPILNCYSHK